MAKYRISGYWKDSVGAVSAYALHHVFDDFTGKAIKTSKETTIELLETGGVMATTWLWDYATGKWVVGDAIHVVSGPDGKYLRSNPDNKKTDNLVHLIALDWMGL